MNVTLTAVVLLTTAALCCAADAECKYRKTRKLVLHWPDPTDCTRYYRCTNRSVKREVVCAEGKVYNSKTGKCSNYIEGLCKLTLAMPLDAIINVCANETSGVYLDQPGYCRNFYICNQNQAYPQVCDAGSRFNSTTRTCIPDTDSECWQNKCIGENNGTYLPNESSCSSFYVCAAGETIEQECGSGSYFNSSKRICLPDPDGQFCWENLCVGKKDGEFVQDVKDCYSYYICVSAKPIQQYCPEGSYFNSTENSCLPGECSPVTTECPTTETTESTTECISESTESTPSTECTEVTTSATETTESTTECLSESTESAPSTECTEVTTPATEATCDCPGGYKEGELIPFPNYPENCDKYYECSNGKLEEKECGEGNGFNSTLGVCEPDVDHICWPVGTTECSEVTTSATEATCDCPGDYKEGELIPFPNYPENCDKYYECSNGKLEEKECGEGNSFNSTLGVCEPDVDHICWPVVTTECSEVTTSATEATCDCPGGYKEGELIPFPNYPENCDKYYECSNGKLEEKECGEGNSFNSTLGVCEPDVDHICWPVVTTECSEVTTSATEATCDCPGGYKEGELIPFPNYPENCDKYYECSDGKLVEKECGEGNSFNSTLGVCEPDVDHICWPVVTTECSEVTTPATVATCDCPGGYKEGELIPFPNYPENCDKYYECSNGKLEKKECGEGNSFNSTLGVCEPDVDHICWPVVTTECSEVSTSATEATCDCPGGCKEGELIPFPNYPENCDKYYECSNGKLEKKECGEGNSFNSTLGVCEPDVDHICWPVVTTECSEVTTSATEATCDCPGGYKEGELIPFPNYPENCDKYYECSNGKLVEKECGEGNRFNSTFGVCQPDIENVCSRINCDARNYNVVGRRNRRSVDRSSIDTFDAPLCLGLYTEGVIIGDSSNCRKYQICVDGEMISEDCGFGNYFNSNTLTCNIDTQQVCIGNNENANEYLSTKKSEQITDIVSSIGVEDCSCPGGYKEGELLPFPNYPENCDKYYICTDGRLQERECGKGNYFDSRLGVCVPDVDNKCWPAETNCTCPGGYKEGELLPFPNYPENCDKYYICTDGRLQERECGEGNYFDSQLGVCVPDVDNKCWPAETNCTCPGGYKEGELLPFPNYPENCDKYYICTDGRLQERECGEGNYFDSHLGVCVPDVDNTCWPNLCYGQIDGTYVPDSTNCTSFYLCQDGKGEIYNCPPEKWFNPVDKICMPDFNATCINPCKDTTGITFLPNPDCSKYFLCNDCKPYVETCPEGGFDITLNKCHADAVCEATLCVGKSDGTTYPFVGNDTKFYLCMGGVAQIRECKSGQVFNKDVGVCLEEPSSQCNQTECQSTNPEDNAFAPLTNTDNTAFCLCRGDSAFLHHCADNYTFRADLGICYSNAPCDPELCDSFPENTRSQNRNNSHSFCLCVSKQQVIVDCPNNQTYNAVTQTCQVLDERCSSTFCLTAPEYSTFPALNNDTDGFCECVSSGTTYKLCGNDKKYNAEKGICLPEIGDDCSSSLCSGNAGLIYGAASDPHSFCYCINDGLAIKQNCPNSEIFNETLFICQAVGCDGEICSTNPSGPFPALNEPYAFCVCGSSDPSSVTKHDCANGTRFDPYYLLCKEDPCDKNFCSNSSNNGIPYPANHYQYGYCVCKSGIPELISCSDGNLFNPVSRQCESSSTVECDVAQCANTTSEYPFAIAAKNDTHGFCYCFSLTEVEFFLCPDNALFDPISEICNISCTKSAKLLELNQGISTVSCLGTYGEGEYVPHRTNNQLFYVCYNAKLLEGDCGAGNIFDQDSLTCQPLDKRVMHQNTNIMRTGEIPENNKWCIENEKRSVLFNCSQYEVCLDGDWTRLSCPDRNIFSQEERACIELRDDMICIHGRVTIFPNCSTSMELHTVPGKDANCTQYYRCNHGKWRLKNCPKQHFYSKRLNTCIPSTHDDVCTAQNELNIDNMPVQEFDCRHMEVRYYESNCAMYLMCLDGKWWHHYCPLGVCANSTDGGNVAHPYDCQAYYECSTLNGTELRYCAEGEYYHNTTGECHIDRGECRAKFKEHSKCQHGKSLSHERYCNIYFACVRGLAIPAVCPAGNHFNSTVGHCVFDPVNNCENGSLSEITYNIKSEDICKNLSDGNHLPDMIDCTKYYVCLAGMELRKQCPSGAYFDTDQQLCVPDDGSCPYVVKTESNLLIAPPEPSVCEGKHGDMMPDLLNCNEFYVCINGKLRHERCYTNYYFNSSLLQCQSYTQAIGNTTEANAVSVDPHQLKLTQTQCKHKPSNYTELCLQMPKGSSIAEPGDCRRYVSCNDVDGPVSQRCRNGESYDSLLGFCRQNDGTCLLENGQRVGECNARHGVLVRDEDNCQAYFVCINGQKIPGSCNKNEYFDKIQTSCLPNENNQCDKALNQAYAMKTAVSCLGLGDSILYPYTLDNCRSYFQCVQGKPVVHKCADGLYFNASITRCVKDVVNCTMPAVVAKRALEEIQHKEHGSST
ncbi:uncharacterized protein LOC120776418 isoform X3 [Bactrocera tryoni]|uniref:uncharacterized protein LOC120776418 isoform X3 n=1 Tax=Bactrocera tryoni TaxID=59916 RepID=UPI001A991BFA|nr:uncharacterized protein LOC120776418 isoform X3 [Bactrocera tryoni]